jgi:hypothetical protein
MDAVRSILRILFVLVAVAGVVFFIEPSLFVQLTGRELAFSLTLFGVDFGRATLLIISAVCLFAVFLGRAVGFVAIPGGLVVAAIAYFGGPDYVLLTVGLLITIGGVALRWLATGRRRR